MSTIYVNKAKESKVRIQLLGLLTKMLKYDQKERLNAIQVCNHEWIKEEMKLQRNNTLKEFVTKCNINKKTTDVKEDKNIPSNCDYLQSVDSVDKVLICHAIHLRTLLLFKMIKT
jgi:hypothetical protein